jgi:hypothetical protein
MNTESVFNNSGIIVSNPNYNPKTKKGRGQQPFFHTLDTSQDDTSGAANAFASNVDNTWVMGDTHNYQRYGVTPNLITNLDKERADNQSAFAKFGNAFAQTVVSEIGLGTVLGFSDLVDFVGSKILRVADDDYSNPVSKYLEGLQDTFNNEVAPIYATPGADISNGGLLDAGWWASNIPSIASSLTLLLPSAGVTKGIGALAKAAKLSSGTRKTVKALTKALGNKSIYKFANKPGTIAAANRFLENGMTAALSRTMENYQEGRGVYDDMYAEASDKIANMSDAEYNKMINNNPDTFKDVDVTDKDAVAKAIAKDAADTDFYGNYVNGINDLIELYALRNAFGSGALKNIGRASVRKAQRNSIRYAGMTAEQIEKAEAARSFMSKAGERIGDALFGSKLAVTAQLGEGAEEAWNYIMQEEGMNTGRMILGTNAKPNAFDDRLASYVRSPQLWESAFWGVLGGVVFQAGGSYLNRVSQTIKDRSDAKKKAEANKNSETTKEETPEVSWRSLSQLPEVQRRVKDIESRAQKLDETATKLKQINDGINPNDPNSTIDNEVDKEAARNMVTDNAITDITLSSLNNGNFELTKEYFADDKVRQAMVDKGIVSEEDSKAYQQEVLNKMDKIKDSYESNIVKLNDIAGEMDETVPIEFIQIAATDNIYHQLNVESLLNQQSGYLRRYNEAKEQAITDGKLDGNIDYDTNVRLQMDVNTLYNLYTQRRELEKEQKTNATLSGKIALDNINKNIKTQQRKLFDNASTYKAEDTLFALANIYSENKAHGEIDADIENVINDAVNTGSFRSLEKFLDVTPNTIEDISDADKLTEFKKKYLDRSEQYKKAMQGLESLGKQVSDDYRNSIALDTMVQFERNSIVGTKEEFNNYITNYNNTLNEMRKNAINDSYNVLMKAAEKYGTDNINSYLESALTTGDGNIEHLADYTEEDKSAVKDAVKVLNFSNVANKELYPKIAAMFDALNYAKTAEEESGTTTEESTESSTTNQNLSGQTITPTTNNQSPTIEEQLSGTQNTSQSNLQSEEQQEETPKVKGYVNVTLDNTNLNSVTIASVEQGAGIPILATNNENVFELDLASVANPDKKLLLNRKLFRKYEGASLMDGNYVISQNPTVRRYKNGWVVAERGTIEKQDDTKQSAAKTEETPTVEPLSPKVTPTTVEPQADTKEEAAVVPPVANVDAPKEEEEQQDNATSTSSTGGLEQSNYNTPEFAAKVAQAFGQYVNPMDETIDFEGATTKVVDDMVKAGVPADVATRLAIDRANIIKSAHEKLVALRAKAKTPLAASATNLAYTARLVEPEGNQQVLFDGVFSNFVRNYVETQLAPKVDGKHVVSLADIFKICNDNYDDKNTARVMFDNIKKFLLTPVGKAQYLAIDINEPVNQILSDTGKTSKELHNRNGEQTYSTRVDIIDFIDLHNSGVTTKEDSDAYFDELNKLTTGDEVDVIVSDKELIISSNGVTIGKMPKVQFDGSSYIMHNESWKTDVRSNGDGTVSSQLKDTFLYYFTSQDADAKTLRGLAIKAFVHRNEKLDNNLLSQVANHPLIKDAISKGLIFQDEKTGDIDYQSVIKHLGKLYRYTTLGVNAEDLQRNIANITSNLNDYFEKLYNSYDTINNIKTSTKVKVSYINEGQINRVIDDSAENVMNHYDELPYSSQGIADLSSAKLGITDPRSPGSMIISDDSIRSVEGFSGGSTFVAVYSRNKEPDYVKAIGVRVSDARNVNLPVKDIYQSVLSNLQDNITSWLNNNTAENFKTLTDSLYSIFAINGDNTISLFRAISGRFNINEINTENGRGIEINHSTSSGQIDSIKIYTTGKYGGVGAVFDGKSYFVGTNTSVTDVANTLGTKLVKFMETHANFNISKEGIQSDNTPAAGYAGFITRQNGKLVVDIPSKNNPYHAEYNSYSDFVLQNNLVKVNTFIGKDNSNFESRGNKQRANQSLYIDLPRTTSLKPSASKEDVHVSATSSKEKVNQVKDILTGTSTNKAEDIIAAVKGREFVDKIKEEAGDIYNDLFPSSIEYTPEINKYENGKYSAPIALTTPNGGYYHIYRDGKRSTARSKKGIVRVGGNFLNLIGSNLTSSQNSAIRKLIHENIHNKLAETPNGKARLLKEVSPVYLEFKEHLKQDLKLAKDKGDDKTLKVLQHLNDTFSNYTSAQTDTILEEFVVESLTNKAFYDYLNSIESTNVDNSGKENLFTKIARFIAKLFGWSDYNENSLYAKELQVIRDAFDDSQQVEIQEETTNNTEEEQQETPPVEDVDSEPTIDISNFGNEIEDDEIMDEEDEDYSNLAEPYISEEETSVTSLSKFEARLPISARDSFKNLVNDGTISLKCSL